MRIGRVLFHYCYPVEALVCRKQRWPWTSAQFPIQAEEEGLDQRPRFIGGCVWGPRRDLDRGRSSSEIGLDGDEDRVGGLVLYEQGAGLAKTLMPKRLEWWWWNDIGPGRQTAFIDEVIIISRSAPRSNGSHADIAFEAGAHS